MGKCKIRDLHTGKTKDVSFDQALLTMRLQEACTAPLSVEIVNYHYVNGNLIKSKSEAKSDIKPRNDSKDS